MINRLPLAFVVLVIGVAQWSSAFADSTHEMLSACRPVARAEVSGDEVKLPSNFGSGECWGAFTVLQKVIYSVDAESLRPIFSICAPAASTRSQLITVFVQYAERHPQRLHEDFFVVGLDSLRMAFPCKPQR